MDRAFLRDASRPLRSNLLQILSVISLDTPQKIGAALRKNGCGLTPSFPARCSSSLSLSFSSFLFLDSRQNKRIKPINFVRTARACTSDVRFSSSNRSKMRYVSFRRSPGKKSKRARRLFSPFARTSNASSSAEDERWLGRIKAIPKCQAGAMAGVGRGVRSLKDSGGGR